MCTHARDQLGKQALDAAMLEMGRMVAEIVMVMEREVMSGPDYHPTDPAFTKWAHEEGPFFIGDQKVKVNLPLFRQRRQDPLLRPFLNREGCHTQGHPQKLRNSIHYTILSPRSRNFTLPTCR